MVVVSGQLEDRGTTDDAMSSSDAEDELIEPATPTPTNAVFSLQDKVHPLQLPEVIPLNVGGMGFTTRLSTLLRYEDTMLAAMFSGRHYVPTDAEGRYFIDRDGTYFGDILNFLRCGDLPPQERVKMVYKEAQYYSIGPLLDILDKMQPLTGEKVRQAFLDLMPYYKGSIKPCGVPCGGLCGAARRKYTSLVRRRRRQLDGVVQKRPAVTPAEHTGRNNTFTQTIHLYGAPKLRSESESKLFEHHCEVDVSFGPWEAVADVYDLLHCIVTDLSERGIAVEHQCIGVCDKHLINHYYCKRPIYEFKITWW
ncbi:hypothetical protein XELAEV_18012755mg [Xenopus laevis]|uniref:BTB/POZ domain-containing protein KCTD7 n=1 Tax=Xenopus laevis TaxID=8355 RepID=A0A974HYF2_XENLA|nr:hypothetical protein XELAEV_18012755mg [Xenopus laevis]